MNVTCPNCATVYRVDPAKVPDGGVRARCSICSAVFAVRREGEAQEQPPVAARGPTATPAPVAAPAAASVAAPVAPPAAPAPTMAPSPPRAEPTRPAEPPTAPPPTPRPVSYPPPSAPMAAPRPAAPAAPAAPAPAMARPAAAAPPPAAPASPAAPAAAAPSRSAGPGSRPVNPFLSQDPALKARRLARALISDMVVYHPAKRQEGLRDGTLKELFEDEIRKSWEEYADQVGKDVADGTPYFKEALNEILAGGRQIF